MANACSVYWQGALLGQLYEPTSDHSYLEGTLVFASAKIASSFRDKLDAWIGEKTTRECFRAIGQNDPIVVSLFESVMGFVWHYENFILEEERCQTYLAIKVIHSSYLES